MDGPVKTVQDRDRAEFNRSHSETPMALLGSHLSIAGGYYKAVEAAAELRMDCVQIFTKNNNQWKGKPLTDDDISRFREAIVRTGIRMPCAHDSYLINLASPDEALWSKSLEAFIIELERAEALGLVGVVMHPGASVGASEEESLTRIVTALERALEKTKGFTVEIWLETTAGQGSTLGHRFEHLRAILDGLAMHPRVGVCVDSCHLLAAGYPLAEPAHYAATMKQLDEIVGIDRIRAFHLNDSKRELGSRVDRHEHIGKGHLGREAFRNILTDKRFAGIPMYLETPKGVVNGRNLDAQNLATLRRLAGSTRKPSYNRKRR
jgi:deoxyribonuclease IV